MLVTSDVPRHALVAGVPARVIRERVSWDRRRTVAPAGHARLKNRIMAYR